MNDIKEYLILMSPKPFQTSFIVAAAGAAGKERCPVIPFQLPDLDTVTNRPFLIQDAGEVAN
jgi:hypothetical protein